MSIESIRLLRDILFRGVIVAILFTGVLAAITFGTWDFWVAICTDLLRTDEAHLTSMVLRLFTDAKFFVVYILLIPALALHWTVLHESRASLKSAGYDVPKTKNDSQNRKNLHAVQ